MSETYRIDGALFAQMVKGGAVYLRNNAQTVNELNVFPIPDGDTGENMSRTIEGGVAAAVNADKATVSCVADVMADGMLLAARGNSGVILSQFFEGVRRGLKGVVIIDVPALKKGMHAGVKQAYDAVVQPTEGTILTVMREATAKADEVPDKASLEQYFDVFIDELYASLDRTPDLLPVLKEAGVIDSGGAGFVYIMEGMSHALRGETVEAAEAEGHAFAETAASGAPDTEAFTADSEMEFGYCTELIVQLMNAKVDVEAYDVETLIQYLNSIGGDSIVAFKTGTRIKLHVHTFEPDRVLEYCRSIGEFVTVKVENMSIQHTGAVVRNRFERKVKTDERKKFACVTVADGEGLIAQMRELGADYVIDGKQTMNPSTNDFITAFDAVNADVIFVLPNNSNIILTAKQAAALYKKSRIEVIPSSTLAEGFSALSMHDYSSGDAVQIATAFVDAVKSVMTGLVTYSIRDCKMNGMDIVKGDWIGFSGKALVSTSKDMVKCANALLDKTNLDGKSVVIAIRGKNGPTDADIAAIGEHLAALAPDMEYYDMMGDQDVYSIIFVIE